MLILDSATGNYDADPAPSIGSQTLFDFNRSLIDGEAQVECGNQSRRTPASNIGTSAFPYFAIKTGQAVAASLTPKREWTDFRFAVPKPARLETTPFETQPLAADAGHPPVGFRPAATLLEWLE